jgi:hypothetical protein
LSRSQPALPEPGILIRGLATTTQPNPNVRLAKKKGWRWCGVWDARRGSQERNRQLLDGGFDYSALRNLRLVHLYGNPLVVRHLELLPMDLYSACLVLSDELLSVMQSDSACLASLVLVRTIQVGAL